MTIIELFAGIGTQISALSKIDPNIRSIGISEIDERPLKAYKALNGEYNNFGDITKIDTLPYADIWTYSFPCTDISALPPNTAFRGRPRRPSQSSPYMPYPI